MPTGYTYNVRDGSLTDFRDFAMQCARAFGACIELRDPPASTPIPDEFKPSDYHSKGIADAKAVLARIQALTDRDVAREADAEYETAVEGWRKRRAEKTEDRQRYEAMLAKAQAWSPPTREHQGLKDFMCEQLAESLRFDCSDSGSWDKMPTRQTEADWLREATERAQRNVEYHTAEHAKEVERCRGRTEWVRALRGSL